MKNIFEKINSFWRENNITLLITIVVGGISGALVTVIFVFSAIGLKSWGSVADWTSGIGSFSAILMVLFQINKDKESTFSQSRPFFKINYGVEKINQKPNKVYYDSLKDNNDQLKRTGFEYQIIEIKNISTKMMLAVQVTVFVKKINYNNEIESKKRKIEFKVDSIKPDETVDFILRNLSKQCGFEYISVFEYYNFDEVVVYFTTELREKIKLIFEKEGESLVYKKNFIENKGDRIKEKEYTINAFKESKILNK